MLVSIIKQYGLKLYADPKEIPFQYSANVQMKFIRAPDYEGYKVMGFYQAPGDPDSSKIDIDDDGIFNLGPQIFKRRGTLCISFSLYKDETIIHLGTIEFEIRDTIGDTSNILPVNDEVWIKLVKKEVDEYLDGLDIGGVNVETITEEELNELWNKN